MREEVNYESLSSEEYSYYNLEDNKVYSKCLFTSLHSSHTRKELVKLLFLEFSNFKNDDKTCRLGVLVSKLEEMISNSSENMCGKRKAMM